MYVFWDWNGTLCDDVLLALEAVNAMLRKRGRQPIDLQTYYRYIDVPISRFYEHLFDLKQLPMDVIAAEYHAYYREHLRDDCLMPSAYETLCTLRRAGVHQVLLSSGHRDSIYPILQRLGLLPFFEQLLLSDTWDVPSKTERAKLFCASHGLEGKDVWFVGDMLHDLETANVCNAHCLLIAGGHQSEEQLRMAGECFCERMSDVPDRLGIFASFAEKD